jgi:hypothetical protein
VKDQRARRRRRIKLLRQALEGDPLALQPGDQIDQIFQRAPQPVQAPDDQRIARTEMIERLRQSSPLRLGPAHGIGEDAGAASNCERILLQIQRLVLGRDSCVARGYA